MPYFGKWPFWMPFFLESCRYNPDFDWLFFSDCGTPENLPDNVRIRAISFADYCEMISQRLDIRFAPPSPYKLCDLKPAYGLLHAEDLQGYDFWAFGDIDVVYGQLRDYFTTEYLARYDLISSFARRVSGPLTLIRNTQEMRELFQRVPNWRERFCGPHEALDEAAFTRIFLKRKNFPKPLFRLFNWSTNPLYRKSDFQESYSTPEGTTPWIDGSHNFPREWVWRHGHLTSDRSGDREFPYLHFMRYKPKWEAQSARVPECQSEAYRKLAQSGAFRISREGFSSLDVQPHEIA
jgi:hypothetical protein